MLFDKNGFYMPNKTDDISFALNILDGSYDNNIKIYNLEDAFKRGNLFPGLYDPYDGYEVKSPKVKNAREKMLLEIQMLDLSITDLNLYLDLNPDDAYAYQIFKKYVEECKKKKEEFSKMYEPLVLDDVGNKYEWYKGNWPWEDEVK